jgi:hypothetical protein
VLGRNWSGPGTTGKPQGAPFPPGIYTLRVQTTGTIDFPDPTIDGGLNDVDTFGGFAASATLSVLLSE